MDVSTCPYFRPGQLRLSWPAGMPWPWLEQKPNLDHTFTMECCSVALRFSSLHISSPSSVWLVLGLRPESLKLRWGLNSCRINLITAYCVVVFVTSCSRTALSLVAADDMLSMSPLKESMNSSDRIAPGGGTWVRLLDTLAAQCLHCARSHRCSRRRWPSQRNPRRGWSAE